MRCSYCGFENPEKSKFCGKCGKALAIDIENIKFEELTEDERTKLQLYSFIGLGCAIIVLIGSLLMLLLGSLQAILTFFGGGSRSDIASIILIGGLMFFVGIIVNFVVTEKERTIKKKLK